MGDAYKNRTKVHEIGLKLRKSEKKYRILELFISNENEKREDVRRTKKKCCSCQKNRMKLK